MAGLVFGFTAYTAHLYGGYTSLESEIQSAIKWDWRFRSLSEEERAIMLEMGTDLFLQEEVGQTGLWGQFLLNTTKGAIFGGRPVAGENSIIGWITELSKCAVMVLLTGWSFLSIGLRPELTRDR